MEQHRRRLLLLALLLWLLGFRCRLGATFGFALFFFLTLLDDFRLGRRSFCSHRSFWSGLFFLLENDDVSQHTRWIGQQLHFFAIEREIPGAKLFADEHLANVHLEFLGDISRQALDFHFASHHFENAALHLHALRLAKSVHGNADAHAHVHSDAKEIHVEQRPADGFKQPIFHHVFFRSAVGNLHSENSVVTRLRTQNAGNMLRVHRERDRIFLSAVKNGRDHASKTRATRRALSTTLANFAFYCKRFHTSSYAI